MKRIAELAAFKACGDWDHARHETQEALGAAGFSETFPPDEPLFLLRASGEQAEEALEELLHGYSGDAMDLPTAEQAYSEFIRWRHEHPDRVKVPG